MRRRRGNPNWGKPQLPMPVMHHITMYELLLNKLGINAEDEMAVLRSDDARVWIRKHCHRRYVPESILKTLGLENIADYGALDLR